MQPASFAQRLAYVCELDGITVPQLAKICEVSERTIRRWLRGQCRPRDSVHFVKSAMPLNVDFGWLFCNVGPKPEEFRWRQLYDSLNSWERHQYVRLALRLGNGSARARRLLDLFTAGQISRTQLLQAM